MYVNCYSYQAAVLGCSATSRFVAMEAAREQVQWLIEVLVCHCHATVVVAVCKCPQLCCVNSFLPEMVLDHSKKNHS